MSATWEFISIHPSIHPSHHAYKKEKYKGDKGRKKKRSRNIEKPNKKSSTGAKQGQRLSLKRCGKEEKIICINIENRKSKKPSSVKNGTRLFFFFFFFFLDIVLATNFFFGRIFACIFQSERLVKQAAQKIQTGISF
ncbi:hypothetical protein LI328DRAFT_114483 [Trichoderma asperelloides]|nr:hypothetical protein LI328DRAFT_114483 [Trichoderma asperelloides]